MPLFQPGNIPANKGKLTPRTARIGAVNSAIAACRTGGKDPIAIQIETARWLFGLAAKIKDDNAAAFERPGLPENAPVVDRVIKVLELAAKTAQQVAEFAYPKLSRIQHAGDPGNATVVENKMIVTLNIDASGGPQAGGNGQAPALEHQPATGGNGQNGA